MTTLAERVAALEAQFEGLQDKIESNNQQALHDRRNIKMMVDGLKLVMEKGFADATLVDTKAASDIRLLLNILEQAKGAKFLALLILFVLAGLSGTGLITLIGWFKPLPH